MKQYLRKLAEQLGYVIVPAWQIDSFPGERHLARLLKVLGVDLVVDVGANAGQYHDMLRRIGYDGPIVSFEPNPELASALKARARTDKNWTVDQRALGASAGTAEFHIMADSEFSSFHAPRHDQVALFRGQNAVSQNLPVTMTTMDAVLPDLVQRFGAKRVYLKLDTQGHDLEVLKGGPESLPLVAALQTEASVRPIYEGAPIYQEIIGYLTERGFVMSGIFPNNSGHFPLLVEFDCHMIARPFAGNAGLL